MKTPTLIPADRTDATAVAHEIRQRPGHALASAWIAQRGLEHIPAIRYATDLYRIARAIELSTGAKLEEDTVAVALEDAGIPISLVRYRDGHVGGEVHIDETVILDPQLAHLHGEAPSTRMRVWSDDSVGPVQ